ncbi:MAG: hypothetical protein M3R30_08925 [Candidatus Eremiobacteraeota bacterium]|nr:hypothetical protein [Candidatus Eremiobacteraeota bacterium]
MQYVNSSPSAYGVAVDTAALKTWIGDANSINASVDSTTPSTFPAATALPNGGSVTGMGYDATGNILVNSYSFATSSFISYMSGIKTGATLTFVVSCSGGMTRAIAPGFGCVVTIRGTAVGAASLTVTGSDGRSVLAPFAVGTPLPM